ncbi:MAG: type II secretion system F family protein [Vulcanimicrobiota bacterium]
MWSLRPGPDARMRSVFFRSLATMFSSGVPLVAALDMLAQQQESPELAEACTGMAKKLQEGHYLSRAMQNYPALFKPIHQKLVMSGERSGQLNGVLARLADREERHGEMMQKLKSSLTMPLIVSLLCISLAFLAPPLLFRGLFQMIAEVGGELPWTTRLLMAFSSFVLSPWFVLLAGLSVVGGGYLWRRLKVDSDWQLKVLSLPHLGESLRLLYIASFVQNLRTMLDVGMPLLQALDLSARATDLECLNDVMSQVAELVKQGEALSDALAGSHFFPSSLAQGVRASEEAGKMTGMLANLESIYRVELEQRLDSLMAAMEPMVLAVIGTVVGFTLVATLQPMLAVLDRL